MCLVHPCILSRTLADSAGSLVLLPVLAGQHAGVDVVNRVVELIDGQSRHRVLVAVDGSDAAGKTTFADRLASAVEAPTVRVSVDSRNVADAPPGPELVALAGAEAPSTPRSTTWHPPKSWRRVRSRETPRSRG